MIDGESSKRYPWALVSNAVTEKDGYSLYRTRPAEDGGKLATVQMWNVDVEVDDWWIFHIRLSKTYKVYINMEYYKSVKLVI